MILLEQIVNQCLLEEGQIVSSITDLGLDWDKLESLLESTYEQAKRYLQIYDTMTINASTTPQVIDNIEQVRRVTYDVFLNYNRLVQDIPQEYWDFNPNTKQFKTLASMQYIVEYLTYPACGYLTYTQNIASIQNKQNYTFKIPGSYEDDTFEISKGNLKSYITGNDINDSNIAIISGDLCDGTLNLTTFKGTLTNFTDIGNTPDMQISYTTKYKAIDKLGLHTELFNTWFKANLIGLIGAIKSQTTMSDIGLPFDTGGDNLLSRASELRDKVEQLKIDKQTWWNFS